METMLVPANSAKGGSMQRNNAMKNICVLVLILCLTLGGFVRHAQAQEGDSVTEGIMAIWSGHESTAQSAADGVRATVAAYGRCVAENWYRLSSGQGQACDVRALFASDASSQAEAQYLYDLNTYWLQWGDIPSAGTSVSAVFNPVVTDIQISGDGQTATASVAATWTKQERSATPAENQDVTDSATVCNLTLRYENGAWRITHEDCPADQIRRDQFPMGTDFAKLIQEVPAKKAAVAKHEKEAEVDWQKQVQHMRDTGDPRYAFLSESDRQLAASPAGVATPDVALRTLTYTTYNRDRALNYSNLYCINRNTRFHLFYEECQNWGSQCVWYGCGGADDAAIINSIVMPMISSGVPGAEQWWCTSSTGTSTWSSGEAFETMTRNNLNSNNYGVQANCGAYNESLGAPVSSISVGDLVRVHYHDPNNNHALDVFHTMVVVQVNGTYGGIWVSSHNQNFQKRNLLSMYASNIVDLEHIVVYCNPPGT
jgi:hypothetical protein